MPFPKRYDHLFLRDGKLYFICGKGLLVMRAWPPYAWFRESRDARWIQCRPELFSFAQGHRITLKGGWNSGNTDLLDMFGSWQGLQDYCRRSRSELETYRNHTILGQEPLHISEVLQSPARREYEDVPRLAKVPPRAWFQIHDTKWFRRQLQKLVDIEKFYLAVPAEVCDAIRDFPDRHYSLTSLCARCPGGLDLLYSTPHIAYMLANCFAFGKRVKRPLRSARALLAKKQIRQLEWLGFAHPSKSTVRILRKIPKKCCNIELLLYLREALQSPIAHEFLSHVTRINRGVVRIVSDPNLLPWASHSLLNELGHDIDEDVRAKLGWEMQHVIEMGLADGPGAPDRAPFRSVHDVRQRYVNLLEIRRDIPYDGLLPLGAADLAFPEPPIEGNSQIVPIRTFKDLLEEGRQCRHCIASYTREIIVGQKYAYRVQSQEERATLLLTYESGEWVVSDCRGMANRSVSQELEDLIGMWLRDPKKFRDEIKEEQSQLAQLTFDF